MLYALEAAACRLLEKDTAWWGLRRLKPGPDQPYTSKALLLICLVYGLPLVAVVYVLMYILGLYARSVNPLSDPTTWLPRAAAWGAFVLNSLANGSCAWLWNRRAFRLNPQAFRGGTS